MAGEQDDPVSGGVTDGDASFGGGSKTTPSRGGFEDFTIDELRDQIIGDSHEAEGAARELGRRTRTEQKEALTALIALARGRGHYARQRVMKANTLLVSQEVRVSILNGTLLWPREADQLVPCCWTQ